MSVKRKNRLMAGMILLALVGLVLFDVASGIAQTTDQLLTRTGGFAAAPGASPNTPQITLNSPANGATTGSKYMHLNADVTSVNPAKVWFYGGTTATPTDLLYVRENVTGTQTIDCNWNMQPFDPESDQTMGLWHLDEGLGTSTADAGSNGNNGTLAGTVSWTTGGRFGYGLDLNGTSGYVSVPDAASLDIDSATGAISMEMWLYPHVMAGGYRTLIGKWTDASHINYQISLDATNHLLFYSGHWPQIWVSSIVVPVGEWSYVAVTLQASERRLRFYRNGVLLDSTVSYSGNGGCFAAANNAPISIGQRGGGLEFFDGLVDEVRLTRRALSSAEIAANYSGLTTGTYYWQVAADDGTRSESEIRSFYSGPDVTPPVITLVSPSDGATTSNQYMTLSSTVSDQSNTKVWIYGDTSASPTELLCVKDSVTGSQNIDYSWNASRLTRQSPNTMGLWHFDEGTGAALTDGSGNGNNGAFSGSPAWSTAGKFGYALNFNGTSDYVSIPDAPSLDIDSLTGAITMEAWIYPHTSGSGIWRSIISKKAISGGSAVNYQISLDQTTGNLLFYSGHYPQIWISSVSVPLNQWSYVAVTLQASEGRLRFYRNGVLLDSTVTYLGDGGSFGPANSTVLTIGTAGMTTECFDGLIDEARLTNRVLSSTEIASNYKLNNGVYHWKVTATDEPSNSSTAGPRQFTIGPADITPPTFSVTLPPSGGTYNVLPTLNLQFNDNLGLNRGYYQIDGCTGSWLELWSYNSGSSDTSVVWPVPSVSQGTHNIYFKVSDDAGLINVDSCSYSWSFTYDNIPPEVPVLLTPADNSITNDNTPDFGWTATAGGGVYTLQYSTDVGFVSGVTTVPDLVTAYYTPVVALSDGMWYWRVKARDQAGNESDYSGAWSFTVDIVPPSAPTGFAIVPGHQKCKLSWTNPGGGDFAGVMIRRNPWAVGAYPEYDDAYPSPLGYPAGPTDGELVYQGTAEAYVDSNSTALMPRNVYYYSIFAYDAVGNYSVAGSEQQGRATNYWLGDVSGDGRVWYEDLMTLSNTFRARQGEGNYVAGFDIGPTVTGSPRGIPTTDNVVDFEDLAIFAINFDVVGPNLKVVPVLGESDVSGGLSLGLRLPETEVAIGDEFAVGVKLRNNPGTVKAVHFVVRYDPSQLEFVSQDRSVALKEASDLLFYNGRHVGQTVDVCLALLGGGSTIGGSGELATLRFRLLRPGSELRLEGVDIRDVENSRLVVENTNGAVAVVSGVPRSYGLSQNYPNPFNPETEIAYQVPQASNVSIHIYNIQGQVVRTLVDADRDAGDYRVVWNGRDDAGNEVATGIYLYRITAGNFTSTKKMILLK